MDNKDIGIEEDNLILKLMAKRVIGYNMTVLGITLDQLNEMSPLDFANFKIEWLTKELKELEDPTSQKYYKYKDSYIKDRINILKERLSNYKSSLKDEKALKGYLDHFKARQEDLRKEISDLMKERNLTLEGFKELVHLPKTCYPNEYISAKDRLTNKLFSGELTETLEAYQMEGKGRKELTAKASINLEELKGVQLSNKNINSYDREVHDAIVSLYVDGGNRYVTPLMIYRTITGNPKAKFSANNKNYNDIINSIEKCSKTRVYIDATGELEGKGYTIEQPIFKENLVYTRSVSGIYNGEPGEWIEILTTPVLYRYANGKNQVARMDINLLNTPVNKNEENIVLQGYLRQRIQTMKGSKLSKNIRYETVYRQLNINNQTYKRLRDKQSKVRNTIKEILEYWEKENFIKGYEENPKNKKSKTSISILL